MLERDGVPQFGDIFEALPRPAPARPRYRAPCASWMARLARGGAAARECEAAAVRECKAAAVRECKAAAVRRQAGAHKYLLHLEGHDLWSMRVRSLARIRSLLLRQAPPRAPPARSAAPARPRARPFTQV
jgi:hypothetical protein